MLAHSADLGGPPLGILGLLFKQKKIFACFILLVGLLKNAPWNFNTLQKAR